MDNIGGHKKVFLSYDSDIVNIIPLPGMYGNCIMKYGKEWEMFRFQPGSLSVNVTEDDESDAGTVYNIEASFNIARHLITEKQRRMIDSFRFERFILKYETNNDESFIAGMKNYPLKASCEILNPEKASGFSGYKISLKGTQLNNILQLADL